MNTDLKAPEQKRKPGRPPKVTKPRVMTPHKFLGLAYGTAASNSGFTAQPHHLVTQGLVMYEAYLDSVLKIMSNPDLLAKLENFDFLPD